MKNLNDIIIVSGTDSRRRIWCQLAYWEECQRVGAMQKLSIPHIHIMQSESKTTESNLQATTSTKVPSFKNISSTSSFIESSGASFSERSPQSPLSQTCDRYKHINIIDSETIHLHASSPLDFTRQHNKRGISRQNKHCLNAVDSNPPAVKQKDTSIRRQNYSIDNKTVGNKDIHILHLTSLFGSNPSPTISTAKTRLKIGNGMTERSIFYIIINILIHKMIKTSKLEQNINPMSIFQVSF